MAAIRPGFHPFWFWNDEITPAEIRRQVAEMAEQGIRGFFIHARQGLTIPYLSERFFDLVLTAVEAAAANKLAVHIYDEYPYPSGNAGGAVTLGDPRFYAVSLRQSSFDVPGGPVRLLLTPGKLLECRAFPLANGKPDWSTPLDLRRHVGLLLQEESYELMGLTTYNRKRYFAAAPRPILETTLPDEPHRIFVSTQTVPDHQKYWGHFSDMMNPDAVRRFMELTHERYRARLGVHFGKTIQSVFVDETSAAWSNGLPAEFLQAYGYDLTNELHVLQTPDHPRHPQVAGDLERLKYRLFCESFEIPISQWCRENGLFYAGEKPALRLSQLRFMDIPGCEPGHVKAGAQTDVFGKTIRANARATASAAWFYKKQATLCECFHSMGWAATLQDAKLIAEELLLAGVDLFVPHGFFYSTHGLRKHDAPPSFFFQTPAWPFFGKLTARIEKILHELAGTHIAADVLLVEPSSGLPGKVEQAAYETIQSVLRAEHVEFLMADTDILESGQIKNGRIEVRGVAVGTVILPPMRLVEKPLAAWLTKFAQAGGRVIRISAEPDPIKLAAEIAQTVKPMLKITAVDSSASNILMTKRQGRGRTFWFMIHTGVKPTRLSLAADCLLREIPLSAELPGELQTTANGHVRELRPFESVLLEAVKSPGPPTMLPEIQWSLAGPATVSTPNRNLLRFNDWRMSLPNAPDAAGRSALVQAAPLSNQLAAGKFQFAPTFERFFGHSPEMKLPKLRVRYECSFHKTYAGAVELVMEPHSIAGDWFIKINESDALRENSFRPGANHIRGSLSADITSSLLAGENKIVVEVETDRLDGGLRNALYLAGDFGVRFKPTTLTRRNPDGIFEDYEANGLPFFAGIVEYRLTRTLAELPAGDKTLLTLDYGPHCQDASEVSVNGGAWQPVLWEPRKICISTSDLKVGRNELRVRVYTSLSRAFNGQSFDPVGHTYCAVEH